MHMTSGAGFAAANVQKDNDLYEQGLSLLYTSAAHIRREGLYHTLITKHITATNSSRPALIC